VVRDGVAEPRVGLEADREARQERGQRLQAQGGRLYRGERAVDGRLVELDAQLPVVLLRLVVERGARLDDWTAGRSVHAAGRLIDIGKRASNSQCCHGKRPYASPTRAAPGELLGDSAGAA